MAIDTVVATYVTQLSNGEADMTLANGFFEDVLGQINVPEFLVEGYTVAITTGVINYNAESINLIYLISPDNVQLGELSIKEADWLIPNWRTATGTAYNFVRESYNQRSMTPVEYEAGTYTLITTFIPTCDLPPYLQMPVALLMLGMEYARESDHQSLEMSKACNALGALLMKTLSRPVMA